MKRAREKKAKFETKDKDWKRPKRETPIEVIDARVSGDTLIAERAFLGALAALVPVPFVDDWLLQRSRKALFRELARRARLYVDDKIVDKLIAEPKSGAVSALGLSALRRLFRRTTIPLVLAGRARAAIQTFQLATLFDHYARERHSGLDLDEESATKLRTAFDQVLATTPPGFGALRSPASYAVRLRQAFDTTWLKELTG
jgi:hypothetical protein